MSPDDEGYFCYSCALKIEGRLYALTRSRQRVHFLPSMPEIETRQAECLSYYCGQRCMDGHLPGVMEAERVPVADHPVGIGPVESCAVCKGPVDMTEFHLAYTKTEELHKTGGVQVLGGYEIAVLCNRCAPALRVADSVSAGTNTDVPEPMVAFMPNCPVSV